jgi:radical SAM protein with 4Fe4S-binding SPASM domain
MDLSLFEKAARESLPLADQVYLHVMGEPLLHPDIARIIEFCASITLPVAVTTNGTLLAEKGEILLAQSVRQVNISLHAHDTQYIAEKILPFVFRALDVRPDLYINLRLWDLDSFDDRSSEPVVQLLENNFNVTITRSASPDRKGQILRGRVYLHRDTVFAWPGSADTEETEGFCRGLGTHCAILADGTVVPCCLDREGTLALGSIARERLRDIISSPRAAAMKAGFDAGKLVEEQCRRCLFCRRFGGRKEGRT